MRRFDLAPDYGRLAGALRDPASLERLSASEFSRAMDAAQDARLLGWFVAQIDTGRIPQHAPPWLGDRVATARTLAAEYERSVRWEIDRLQRAFLGSGVTWVLLKGAGYVAAGLEPGRGRRVADIDILVPEDDLPRTEALLHGAGWEFGELDPYDTRYYREWMHEIPPMVHRERRSVVDVHHAILPRTSRLKPSSARLFERAVPAGAELRVLAPAHMVLHGAAHLFHDGEIAGAIRDVVDLDQLLRRFGREESFWPDLAREAAALGLTRPAYYALRYAREWFGTPVPDAVIEESARWAPPAPLRRLMDALVRRTIPGGGSMSQVAAYTLYVRSHWLRMPPLQVARHLARKSLRRYRPTP